MYKELMNVQKNKVQRFVKTYRNKGCLLEQAFSICRSTREMGELTGSVYEL